MELSTDDLFLSSTSERTRRFASSRREDSRRINEAIDSMDFESASNIESEGRQISLRDFRQTSHELLWMTMSERSFIDSNVSFKVQKIQNQLTEQECQIIRRYQKMFLASKEAHIKEAEDLKARWDRQRDRAIDIAKDKIKARQNTSKVLAAARRYSEAIGVRDDTKERESDVLAAALIEPDKLFKRLFDEMMIRHQSEYQSYKIKMEAELSLVREEHNKRAKVLEQKGVVQKSMSPVKQIRRISLDVHMTPEEKRQLAREFSQSFSVLSQQSDLPSISEELEEDQKEEV